MLLFLVAAAAAADLGGVHLGQPADQIPESSEIELFGFPARRVVERCIHETDDETTLRVTEVTVTYRWKTPAAAAMGGEGFVTVTADPKTAALESLGVIGPALRAEGWEPRPNPLIGHELARFDYGRDGDRLTAVYARANAATWEVALFIQGESRDLCPKFPPEETWMDLHKVRELHTRAGFAYRGPDGDEAMARTVRQWRLKGVSVEDIANLSRYGYSPDRTLEESILAGQQADRSQLLPEEVELVWSRGEPARELAACQRELHLAMVRGLADMIVGGTERTYPRRVDKDPGIPLVESATNAKELPILLEVDEDGRVVGLRPVVPHEPGNDRTDRAMDAFWACAGQAVTGLQFSSGASGRTGRVDLRVWSHEIRTPRKY